MLISKFDLYKTGWLDLVFDDRNKSYGAYELRQHYSRTMLRAMIITFLTIGSAALIAGVFIKPVAAVVAPIVHITSFTVIKPIQPPAVTHPHVAHSVAPPVLHAAPSIVHPSLPVVTPDPQVVNPTVTISMHSDPGPVTIGSGTIGPITSPGVTGPGTPGPSEPVGDFHTLERMPEPYGGAAAWQKFLMKNIKYPDMAANVHAQGAVWVSFIVEADGKLSNFKIQRGAGYGMDEEALRVLKLAPAWKPGIQNGQPVRVSYNIPIRFVLGDDDN